jgi:hypothetical protein
VEKFCKLFDKNIKQKSNPEFAKRIAFDTKQVWKQISDFQDRERIERISGIEFNIIGEYVNAKDESITIPPMSLIMQYSLTVEQDSVLITPQIKLGETSLSQSGWGNIITTNAANTFTELKNAFDAGLVKLEGEMLNKFNPANGDKRIAKHSNRLLIANIITAIAETMEEMED